MENNDPNSDDVNSGSFLIFLIFIFLLLGNQSTFDSYFALLDKETSKLNSVLNGLNSTANGLKSTMQNTKNFEL